MLLVVPQFLVWTFALVWLVQDRDWSPAAAGSLVAAAQLAGAVGRIAAGHLSDVVASRMRPLRWVALAAAATMAALGLAAGLDLPLAVGLMVLATVLTVADNGLAFTAVAERAGPFWSGRALGVQNTAQFLTASVVPPARRAADRAPRGTPRRSPSRPPSRCSPRCWCRCARSDGSGMSVRALTRVGAGQRRADVRTVGTRAPGNPGAPILGAPACQPRNGSSSSSSSSSRCC